MPCDLPRHTEAGGRGPATSIRPYRNCSLSTGQTPFDVRSAVIFSLPRTSLPVAASPRSLDVLAASPLDTCDLTRDTACSPASIPSRPRSAIAGGAGDRTITSPQTTPTATVRDERSEVRPHQILPGQRSLQPIGHSDNSVDLRQRAIYNLNTARMPCLSSREGERRACLSLFAFRQRCRQSIA
jgi:hypothetical protein